jgi:hypothetical protein
VYCRIVTYVEDENSLEFGSTVLAIDRLARIVCCANLAFVSIRGGPRNSERLGGSRV